MFLLLYTITETSITEFCYWNEALLILSSGPFVMLEYGKTLLKQIIEHLKRLPCQIKGIKFTGNSAALPMCARRGQPQNLRWPNVSRKQKIQLANARHKLTKEVKYKTVDEIAVKIVTAETPWLTHCNWRITVCGSVTCF